MDLLQVILRVAHIGAAVAIGGAIVFRLLAVQPALATLDEPQCKAFGASLARYWSVPLWLGVALLVVSGLLTFILFKLPAVRGRPFAGLYHGLFGIKVLAALALFHVAAVLSLPGEHGQRYRARARFWLGYASVLLAVIIVVAAILRYLPTFYA
jgi:uncharacterized membrane protein